MAENLGLETVKKQTEIYLQKMQKSIDKEICIAYTKLNNKHNNILQQEETIMRNMRDEVLEMLRDMDDELIEIHNAYCEKVNYTDDMIYSMSMLNEFYYGKDPLDIILDAYNGAFNPNDNWFRWNGYGNLESTDRPIDNWIDIDEIADYIVENDEDLGNKDIRDLLDEIELENEDEEEEEK